MDQEQTVYRICVQGQLDPRWSEWFAGLEITANPQSPGQTVLSGPVRDQAALRGLLNKLWDLNLIIVSVDLQGDAK
ncbi:MAG: hypothetical protein JXB15_05935 [Anaerolineales bacterium]|nr:hypothetical protein [Anaerolineales bacterium]